MHGLSLLPNYIICVTTQPPNPGRRIALSLPRRWIGDLMHLCRHIPIIPIERRMQLSTVIAARQRLANPPSWAAIFVKAYAITAARHPVLRQAYCVYPWPHLYEANQSIASVAVAREFDGEPAVFFGLIHAPDQQTLVKLTAQLNDFKTKSVEQIRPFARLIRYTRYPLPLRRILWWIGMNLSGRHRAKTIGTFAMTVIAGAGANLGRIISPVATTLTYGPFEADGSVIVRISFDHRVIDGLPAANALADLECILLNEIVCELS